MFEDVDPEELALAKKGELYDDAGKPVRVSDLRQKRPKPISEPVDKNLQALQRTLNNIEKIASNNKEYASIMLEAMQQMVNAVNSIKTPDVNVEAIMPVGWKRAVSRVTKYKDGRISEITHEVIE